MPRNLPVLLLLAATLTLLGAPPSAASAPRIEEIGGEKAFADGELESLALDEEGVLRPGPSFEATELEVPTAWAALEHDGALWIGTGNTGEVLKVDAEGKIQRIDTGERVLVTALAPLPAGAVAAAVVPGGVVLEISATGDTVKPMATLPAEYVWALLPDTRGGLLAATGMPGALWRIDAFGAVEKVADVDDDHARCLARRGKTLLVGTAPKGRVLEIENGKVKVLRDLEAKEVVGIVVRDEGDLLVGANQDQAGGNAQALGSLLGQIKKIPGGGGKKKKKAPERASLQNGVVLWLEASGAVTPLWQGKKIAALSMVKDKAGAILGTYPSGRLYRVEPDHAPSLVADLPEAEASVLLGGEGGLRAVVTSNPVVLHRLKQDVTGGVWTSEPIDGGAVSRWGAVRALGHGLKGLEFRSGETEEPDESWADWQGVGAFDGARGRTGAQARFLQLRATLDGGSAQLRGLSIVVAAPNRAPVVSSLEVGRAGKKDATGIPDPSSEKKISWKVKDPDDDTLRVRLEASREGSPHWIRLVKDEVLGKPQWTWNTAGLPDGIYRVRLLVTDAPSNPPADARETTRTSAPFRVDNSPPRVTVRARPAGDRLLVEGEVNDQAGGRVALIRVSIDGGPWQVLGASDGILDEPSEAFAASVEAPKSGAHDVVVQAKDADGNVGAGATVVKIR